MKTRDRRGVTLIELLTVIMIIMVLAGLLAPVLQIARESARKKKAKTESVDLAKAWDAYWRTYTNWPVGGAQTTIAMTAGYVADLNGNSPNNPWGMKFMDFPRRALQPGVGFRDPWGTPYEVTLSRSTISYTWDYATRVYCRNRNRYEYE